MFRLFPYIRTAYNCYESGPIDQPTGIGGLPEWCQPRAMISLMK